jgi:hypothetical protein
MPNVPYNKFVFLDHCPSAVMQAAIMQAAIHAHFLCTCSHCSPSGTNVALLMMPDLPCVIK